MDFETFTWLIGLQRRGLELAARELDQFEELVSALTPLLMMCDSGDGYEYLFGHASRDCGAEEVVVVSEPRSMIYFFETMTIAHAAEFRPDRDLLVIPLATPSLRPGMGDDLIRISGPERDWRDGRHGYGPPPRKLGRSDYRAKSRRPPSGLRGR